MAVCAPSGICVPRGVAAAGAARPRTGCVCLGAARRGARWGRQVVTAATPGQSSEVSRLDTDLDNQLSKRWLDLDPAGYFLILVDREEKCIIAEHYSNTINKNGVACDPETGKPIPCTPGYVRPPTAVYRGRNAKELSVIMIEEPDQPPMTMLTHANYLGREFQRAEMALISGDQYIQD